MAPPAASGKSKAASRSNYSNSTKAVINSAPVANANRRKTMSSELTLPPPPKEAKTGTDDTLFQGDRELWLAKRLMDPEIYLPLQAGKENSVLPGVRYRTKAAVHRQLASEFNQQEEHAGFLVDEGKIKNKIAKMLQHFKAAHRLRHSLTSGGMEESTWRDTVKEKYTHYFVLEPVWASVCSDGVTFYTDPSSNLHENVIANGPHSTQHHSDEGSEDERNYVDAWSELDQGMMDVTAAAEDADAEDGVDVEEDEARERTSRDRHHSVNRATPGPESQGIIESQTNHDEQPKGGTKCKEQQQRPISSLLNVLNALGRYEIDARKETEMRQMDLIQKTKLAEIELRKAIRLAEINAVTKQEKVVLDHKRELLLERERRMLAKEKELEKLLEIARKQLGGYQTQSTTHSTPLQNKSRSPTPVGQSE
ncbi:hypothetical protein MVEG_11227 [Podila verticillata NRRL 6337]|uniref:Uncharacterized protein n=1 Tax=Podila verticillata NRRL 6337 TaxID=1069443 RepID=A0A086TML5_9FUNG|nr:hypothetical protein MVEG_11227 [Podila verticillata NRRL 6337]